MFKDYRKERYKTEANYLNVFGPSLNVALYRAFVKRSHFPIDQDEVLYCSLESCSFRKDLYVNQPGEFDQYNFWDLETIFFSSEFEAASA